MSPTASSTKARFLSKFGLPKVAFKKAVPVPSSYLPPNEI
jgi:hypothetical protein